MSKPAHTFACPSCGGGTTVVDSRHMNEGKQRRRRRWCEACNQRFTTVEQQVPDTAARRLLATEARVLDGPFPGGVRIVSDGTASGSKLTDKDGRPIRGVVRVSWHVEGTSALARAYVEFEAVPVDVHAIEVHSAAANTPHEPPPKTEGQPDAP